MIGLEILKDGDEEIKIKPFDYYFDIAPYLFNASIDFKKLYEIRQKFIKERENCSQQKYLAIIPTDIKEVYVDKNMFACFYSFYKYYANEKISDEYFKDCIMFLKLIYLKDFLRFEIKPDIALYENKYSDSISNDNTNEAFYSLDIINKIKVDDIDTLSKEELYNNILQIINRHKNKKILAETMVETIYDYWYDELTKIKEYLKTSIMANNKNFKSLLIELIKSQENKEINSMTILFILNSFADKDLNKKRKQFLKETKEDFIRNACFDMVVISYGLLEKNIRLFSKDKALQDYCIKLYKNLNDINSFFEIIKTICEKNKIPISKEIIKLSEELFNKLNDN